MTPGPELAGRTALVTGGTGGLGRAIAAALLDAGASVHITARDAAGATATARELGRSGPCHAMVADLGSDAGCTRLAAELAGRIDALDVLVNNAGTAWGAPLDEFPLRGWDKVMDLNLRAPFRLTQALLPLLTAAGSAAAPARVVNIGSMEGLRVADQQNYSYAASKGGAAPPDPGAGPRAGAPPCHRQRGRAGRGRDPDDRRSARGRRRRHPVRDAAAPPRPAR